MEKVKKIPHSGQNSSTCTGTGQSCTGTGSVLFLCSEQCWEFDHTVLISDQV